MKKRQTKGTKHQSAGARSDQILSAARECFAEHGYSGTSMDHIAAVAGLSKGSLYRFFPSKADMLNAIFDGIEEAFATTYAQAIADNPHSVETLRRILRVTFEISLEQRDLNAVWVECRYQETVMNRVRQSFADARIALSDIVQEGVEAGELNEAASETLPEILCAMNEGLLVMSVVEDEINPLDRFDRLWPDLIAGFLVKKDV